MADDTGLAPKESVFETPAVGPMGWLSEGFEYLPVFLEPIS